MHEAHIRSQHAVDQQVTLPLPVAFRAQQDGLHAHAIRGGRRLSRGIRLCLQSGDEDLAVLRHGFGHPELEVAGLVAAKGQR